jgi:hypothetical protein
MIVIVQIPRDSIRKGAIFLIESTAPFQLKAAIKNEPPSFRNPRK